MGLYNPLDAATGASDMKDYKIPFYMIIIAFCFMQIFHLTWSQAAWIFCAITHTFLVIVNLIDEFKK
jgi:hypothetical protein